MIKQVLSTERMRHLKELGVDTSKASMLWIKPQEGVYFVSSPKLSDGEWLLSINVEDDRVKALCETVPAFTLQDIIDKLPCFIDTYVLTLKKFASTYTCLYMEPYSRSILFLKENKELIDAAYDMLCWCIENGYIGKEK